MAIMGGYIIHLICLGASTLIGYMILSPWAGPDARFIGGVAGLLFGGLLVAFGIFLQRHAQKRFFWGVFGFTAGILVGGLVSLTAGTLFQGNLAGLGLFQAVTFLLFPYTGLVVSLSIEKDPAILSTGSVSGGPEGMLKILDTSVIIDGRIADLCETGFLEGAYVIPQFILQELQHIADSADPIKRARGRRGLDVLQRLQKMPNLKVHIVDDDFPAIKEVDSKLVALGKRISAKVVTNDLNLNKVSELQGVHVLNINQLCNALRPVVLPGESMRVFILKEGKESGQGIGYLDDGTMIVVDDARRWIGKNLDVVVTSVLQTAAGRMIFTRIREEPEREEHRMARNT